MSDYFKAIEYIVGIAAARYEQSDAHLIYRLLAALRDDDNQ